MQEHIAFTLLLIRLTWIYINCFPSFNRWKYNRKYDRQEAKRVKEEANYIHEYYYDRLKEQRYDRAI